MLPSARKRCRTLSSEASGPECEKGRVTAPFAYSQARVERGKSRASARRATSTSTHGAPLNNSHRLAAGSVQAAPPRREASGRCGQACAGSAPADAGRDHGYNPPTRSGRRASTGAGGADWRGWCGNQTSWDTPVEDEVQHIPTQLSVAQCVIGARGGYQTL